MLPLLIPAAVALASEFFPLLVTKIAGDRAGDVAEKVVETAAAVAGLPSDAAPDEIVERIRGDKLAADRLRYEFELLNQSEHERILEDRQSAREYQMAIGARGRRRGDVMLLGVSAGLGLCIALVLAPQALFAPNSETGAPASLSTAELALVTTVSGALLKMLSDAFAFEFGSSRGSKEKDVHLREFKDALTKVAAERVAPAPGGPFPPPSPVPSPSRLAVEAAADETEDAPSRRDFVGELVSEAARG